ncbi:hypothetical protein TNCV_97101 [Trichonephila clavipes]|nr:hypothetical protein TNCV_97101 [Trichonephila clavipes]
MSSFLVLSDGDTRNRWRDEQVCPDIGQGTMAPWARRPGCVWACDAQIGRGRPRVFCDLPIRRDEGRVVNTPLVFKRVLFQERREKTGGDEGEDGRERGERVRRPEETKKKTGESEERERERRRKKRRKGVGEREEPTLYGEKG